MIILYNTHSKNKHFLLHKTLLSHFSIPADLFVILKHTLCISDRNYILLFFFLQSKEWETFLFNLILMFPYTCMLLWIRFFVIYFPILNYSWTFGNFWPICFILIRIMFQSTHVSPWSPFNVFKSMEVSLQCLIICPGCI